MLLTLSVNFLLLIVTGFLAYWWVILSPESMDFLLFECRVNIEKLQDNIIANRDIISVWALSMRCYNFPNKIVFLTITEYFVQLNLLKLNVKRINEYNHLRIIIREKNQFWN